MANPAGMETVQEHILFATRMIADLPALVVAHTPWLVAASSALALASEALPRLLPLRDRRTAFLGRAFDVSPADIVPIGDGIQLWADCAKLLPHKAAEDSMPLGAPTLKASYVMRRNGGLFVICVHNTEDAHIAPDPDDPDYRDGIIALFDHGSGQVHPGQIPLAVDEDCVRRTNLVESLAARRAGYEGAVVPVILWKDPEGLSPDPEDERTLSMLKPAHLRLEDGQVEGGLPPAAGAFTQEGRFEALSRWLLRQPSRTTPGSRLALRAGALALCLALIALRPEFAGHDLMSDAVAGLTGLLPG